MDESKTAELFRTKWPRIIERHIYGLPKEKSPTPQQSDNPTNNSDKEGTP